MHIALLVIPDCLIVALGWVLLHKLKFSREFFTNTEKLVYYILFPALLVQSIAFTPISDALENERVEDPESSRLKGRDAHGYLLRDAIPGLK